MAFHLNSYNVIILLSVAIYFIYDYIEGKRVKDEREELIQLKTFELVQKVNTFTLLLLAISFFFISPLNSFFVIFVLVLSSLYSEIIARAYYRKKF